MPDTNFKKLRFLAGTIMVITCVVLFPQQTKADCNIVVDTSYDPPSHSYGYVPFPEKLKYDFFENGGYYKPTIDVTPQTTTLTVTWAASDECVEPIGFKFWANPNFPDPVKNEENERNAFGNNVGRTGTRKFARTPLDGGYEYLYPFKLSNNPKINWKSNWPDGTTVRQDQGGVEVWDACNYATQVFPEFCSYYVGPGVGNTCGDTKSGHKVATTSTYMGPYWGFTTSPMHLGPVDNSNNSIQVDFDPVYVFNTQKNGHFTPTMPANTYDSFQVVVKRGIEGCTTKLGYMNAELLVKHEDGESERLGQFAPFYPQKIMDEARKYYFQNPDDGRTVSDYLKKNYEPSKATLNEPYEATLIGNGKPLKKNDTVFVRVHDDENVGGILNKQINMTNCVRLFGDGPNSFAFGGAKSLRTLSDNFDLFAESQLEVTRFAQFEPYKKYKDKFKFFLDLQEIDDTKINTEVSNDKLTETFPRDVGCKDAQNYTLFVDSRAYELPYASGWLATADLVGHIAMDVFWRQDPRISQHMLHLFAHETGHGFGGLYDEDLKEGLKKGEYNAANCVTNPEEAYRLGDIFYGSISTPGCEEGGFIPSEKSIMNYFPNDSEKFNVISCAFILTKIKGASASEHFEECSKLLDS